MILKVENCLVKGGIRLKMSGRFFSVVSLLNEPNTFSPANVDASVMFRRWKESKGKDKEYEHIIRRQVTASRQDAERDGVQVPTTMEEYCMKTKPSQHAGSGVQDTIDMDDLYDDDDDCYDIDDDDLDEDEDETASVQNGGTEAAATTAATGL